jgi:oligosaccharide repeat unit polymerase
MISKLVLPPSFYMAASWLAVLLIFLYEPINLLPLRLEALFTIFYVILTAILSSFIFNKRYMKAIGLIKPKNSDTGLTKWFLIFGALGLFGIFKYFSFAAATVGGTLNYFLLFINNPLDIRAIAIDELGGAVQLTYFSWIAIGLGVYLISGANIRSSTKLFIGILLIILFLSNLAFIDRTRPVWLLVLSIICFSMTRKSPRKSLLKFTFYAPPALLGFFIGFALFTGKLTQGGAGETTFQYLLGGFSYLNHIFQNISHFDYAPIRTFYPISKAMESVGLISYVPSQVLEFYNVPYPTNIGTFIEPLFSDGGFYFVLAGVPIIVFGIDWIGARALESNSFFGIFLYGNFIFANLISFFVAQFASTPIYLFTLIFLVARLTRSKRGDRVLPAKSPVI